MLHGCQDRDLASKGLKAFLVDEALCVFRRVGRESSSMYLLIDLYLSISTYQSISISISVLIPSQRYHAPTQLTTRICFTATATL